jgi:hypothetical protein
MLVNVQKLRFQLNFEFEWNYELEQWFVNLPVLINQNYVNNCYYYSASNPRHIKENMKE